MKRLISIICFGVLLSSCVSHKPVPDNYTGPLATVSDSSKRIDGSKAYFFQLNKIDGRDVLTSVGSSAEASYGHGFALTVLTESRQVPATESELHLSGTTYYAAPVLMLKGGNYSVDGKVRVNLEANKIYYIKGELSKEYSAVWVEDSQGKIVSEKVEKKS